MRKSNRMPVFLVSALLIPGGLLLKAQSSAPPALAQTADDAVERLVEVARHDPDADARKEALVSLSRRVLELRPKLFGRPDERTDPETQKQKYEVLAISKKPRDEAIPLLVELIKTHPKAVIRRHALYYLGHSGDERALNFFVELLKDSEERK